MEKTDLHEKMLNYKLLHIYQTNSPTFSNEATIRRCVSKSYAQDLFSFMLGLQQMLCFDSTFNQPNKTRLQRKKIKNFYLKCFKDYPQAEDSFKNFLHDLIGGRSLDYNFAYGLKIYFLFKEETHITPLDKKLFLSRLEANVLSHFYATSPEKKYTPETELAQKSITELNKKKTQYSIFASRTI